MVKVKVDAKNYKSLMKNLKKNVSNMQPAFRQFDTYIRAETKKQFEQEKDPEGNKWLPLSPVTLRYKKTSFILRETFKMSRSFQSTITKKSYEYTLADPKYIFHHNGTIKMPARVVVGIGKGERKKKLNNIMILRIKRTKR